MCVRTQQKLWQEGMQGEAELLQSAQWGLGGRRNFMMIYDNKMGK